MRLPIYMDNHATTPVDPRVLEAMMPFLREEFGNAASSSHAYGWHAKDAVAKARGQLASLAGVLPEEIIFTSGDIFEKNNQYSTVVFDKTGTLSAGKMSVTAVIGKPNVIANAAAIEHQCSH